MCKNPSWVFEDKKHEDGTPYSLKEQIEKTKDQLMKIANEWTDMGRTPEQIKDALVQAVRGLQQEK